MKNLGVDADAVVIQINEAPLTQDEGQETFVERAAAAKPKTRLIPVVPRRRDDGVICGKASWTHATSSQISMGRACRRTTGAHRQAFHAWHADDLCGPMILEMEMASGDAIRACLTPGWVTVGTEVDIRHRGGACWGNGPNHPPVVAVERRVILRGRAFEGERKLGGKPSPAAHRVSMEFNKRLRAK